MTPGVEYRTVPGYRGGPDRSVWRVREARPGAGWLRLKVHPPIPKMGEFVRLVSPAGSSNERTVSGLYRRAFGDDPPVDPALGLVARGSAHGRSKLTEADVRKMRALKAEGWTYPRLAAKFGVSRSNVFYVLAKRTWRHA